MTILPISSNIFLLSRQIARGAIVTVSAKALMITFQLVNMAVLARLLTPADFGLVAMSASVIAFVTLFRDLGLSTATIQRQKIDQNTASGIFVINFVTALLLMFVACVSAPFIAAAFDDPRLATTIIVSSGTIPIAALGAQHAAQFERELQFFTTQWIAVIGTAAGSVGGILLAFYGAGYWALLIGAWIVVLSQTILLWLWSPWRPTRVRNWRGTRSALGFGLSITASSLIIYFSRQFDKLLVGWRWGGEELGYYSRAYAILMIPQTLVSGPISSAVLPGLSRLQSQSSDWRKLLLDAVRITTSFTLLVGALLTANASDIVAIVLGPGWGQSADLVTIFGISMIARAVMNQNPWIYISLGHANRMLRWQLATLPIYLGGIIIGLSYGSEGVAIGFSLVQATLCVPSVFFAAAGTPISGTEILRNVAPMAAVTLTTILMSPLFWIPIGPEPIGAVSALLNLATTSSIFAVGTALVLHFDPAYRAQRDRILRYGRNAVLAGFGGTRERPS